VEVAVVVMVMEAVMDIDGDCLPWHPSIRAST
jgi:hypothetical protein